VRRDVQPQSVPVWFLWDGQTFLIYSQPGRQKLRRIDTNPRVDLNLNSNAHVGDVVRTEGVADIVEDAPPATEVPEYVEKYSAAIIVLPSPGSGSTPRASRGPTLYL
jgi:PPOX class probable F420-dependent enzyme